MISKMRKIFKKAYRFKREITKNRPLFPLRNGGDAAVFFAFSARFAVDIVRRSGYVVDRDVIQPRKLYNAFKRYRAAVVLILRVVALGGVEIFGDFALGHTVFLAQNSQLISKIHGISPLISICIIGELYHKRLCKLCELVNM